MRELNIPAAHVVFYDADCRLCRRLAELLARRGVPITALQEPGVAERLGIRDAELLTELRAITVDGHRLDGADAVVAAARRIRWASPLVGLTRVPGVMPLLRGLYRVVSSRRRCAPRP
jgi:predicted DCC family thiol-disulfide oxidoreductase YuxK